MSNTLYGTLSEITSRTGPCFASSKVCTSSHVQKMGCVLFRPGLTLSWLEHILNIEAGTPLLPENDGRHDSRQYDNEGPAQSEPCTRVHLESFDLKGFLNIMHVASVACTTHITGRKSWNVIWQG